MLSTGAHVAHATAGDATAAFVSAERAVWRLYRCSESEMNERALLTALTSNATVIGAPVCWLRAQLPCEAARRMSCITFATSSGRPRRSMRCLTRSADVAPLSVCPDTVREQLTSVEEQTG